MNEKIINTAGISGRGDIFEIVDEIPLGYTIWNIGKNMIDGYLPLCRLQQVQPFPGARAIETNTLKTIRVEKAQDILAAIGYGPNTPDEMEKYIRKNQSSDNAAVRRRIELYQKAIPILRSIKGVELLAVAEKHQKSHDYEEDIER